jgi:hypothetical protein
VVSIGGLISVMGRGEVWRSYKKWIAAEQTQRAADETSAAFNKEVAPLLNQLNPETVLPIQRVAILQLLRHGSHRTPAVVAETVSKLTDLKAAADEALKLLSSPPIGVESLDQLRSRAKEFAEARSRSFGLLLEMLASDGIPDQSAWTAWGDAKRTASALWEQIRKR